jgi:hypothetical protein
VVIHGLYITVPLDAPRRPPRDAIRAVLDGLASGGVYAHFGVNLDGFRLYATDIDWTFGSGEQVKGPAAELALLMCARTVTGRVAGWNSDGR